MCESYLDVCKRTMALNSFKIAEGSVTDEPEYFTTVLIETKPVFDLTSTAAAAARPTYQNLQKMQNVNTYLRKIEVAIQKEMMDI